MTGDEFLQRIIEQLEVNGDATSHQNILIQIAKLTEAELFNLLMRIHK